MPTYSFAGKCGHTWDIPYTPCNETTCPSCNCGKPYYWLGTEPGIPLVCPICRQKPLFYAIPQWHHMGMGIGDIGAVMKLDLYREKPE